VNEVGAYDSARRERAQRILDELPQGRRACRPDAKGQSEALFLLGEDLVGQEAAQRLLEEPAQLEAAKFPVGRQGHREIGQAVGQQGIGDFDAGHLGGAAHFRQVTVGQRVAPVVSEHAIDQARRLTFVPGGLHVSGRFARIDLGEKISSEYVGRIELHDQVETLQAIGHRHA
jgi:hypothetical protein